MACGCGRATWRSAVPRSERALCSPAWGPAPSEQRVDHDPDRGDRAGVVQAVERAVDLLDRHHGAIVEGIVVDQLAESSLALRELVGDAADVGDRGTDVVRRLLVVDERPEGPLAGLDLV